MKNFDFVKNFKWFAIFSTLISSVGIIGLILLPFGISWFNFDIDFLGGTVMQFELHQNVDVATTDKVNKIVEGITGVAPTIQRIDETGVMIKTLDIDTVKRQAIMEAMKTEFGIADTDLLQSDNVTASVGEDLRNAALLSTLLASALILIYITIRFEFKSGLSAIIALLHDLFVMTGAYIVLQIPVNMNFIAAILTILGYSINANIVVFDRVRENRVYMPRTDFSVIMNASISQTFVRNVNTTVTTLLPLTMIIIMGVPAVQNFAIPLTVGIITGAYSSLFVAGPLWVLFRGSKPEKA